MFQVFFANRTEELAAQLIAQTQAERKISSLGDLAKIHVVVPDRHLATYLKLGTARSTGVFANVSFEDFDTFLDDSLRAHDPNQRLLTRAALRSLLLDALCDADWLARTPELEAARRYIGIPDARLGLDGVTRRRVQLADELSRHFSSYALHRPSVLQAWLAGDRCYAELPAGEVELWQSALFRRVFDLEDGLRRAVEMERGERLMFWHELPDAVSAGKLSLPAISHAFLPARGAQTFYDLWHAISQKAVVFGYALNPCREFWEEMEFGRLSEEDAFSSATVSHGHVDYGGDDAFWTDDAHAPLPLRLWGFAGAQHLRGLRHVVGADSLDRFVAPEGETLLERLQTDMLAFHRPSQPAPLDPDDHSVRVLGAPSVKREVEIIANEIWSLMRENDRAREADPSIPKLHFHDIAVLIAPRDRDLYQTHIRAVFPNTRDLPFNMVDMLASSYSRAVEAVELLLTMPFGQFRRQELLRLLTHPNVLGRFPNLDAHEWMEWCDHLKILHGADRSDHADTYIDGELFHWDQGLKRLVLGAFMTGKLAGDRRAFDVESRSYLPFEYGQAKLTSASRLVLMARSLIEDARFCRDAEMPLRDWAIFVCRLVTTYLVPDAPGDEFVLQECRRALSALADDTFSQRPMSYRVAFELARDALSELEVKRGQYLIDGVVVSGLVPDRPLPFRAIFVAGLSAGGFPEGQGRRPEDLRVVLDRTGSPLPSPNPLPDVSERDLQKTAFLETLMSAREHLVLSYVSRDVRTGDTIEPSPVVEELMYTIEQDYAARAPGCSEEEHRAHVEEALVLRHELRRFHERYFPELFGDGEGAPLPRSEQPEAAREARVDALRRDLLVHAHTTDSPFPTLEDVREGAPRALLDHLGLTSIASLEQAAQEEETPILRVSTHDIRAFLECPLQGSARFLLRFRDEEDHDILLQDSELFETSALAGALLLREVFWEKLGREHHDGGALEFGSIYDERARYFELEGLVPTGPFYRAARNKHLRTLQTWQENLTHFGLGRTPRLEVHRFGRALEQELVDVPREPIALDLRLPVGGEDRMVRVEIGGRTDSLVPGWPGSLITHQTTQVHTLSRRYFLRGFLDHVFLAARGLTFERPWTVFVNPGEEALKYKHKHCVRQFAPMNTADAMGYLTGVLQDMVTQVHPYFMPVEAVFAHHEREESFQATAEAMRANTWNKVSSDFGPIHDARTFRLPEDPEPLIQKRFGPLFDRMVPVDMRRGRR